jgi:hypothetical protein
VTCSDPVVVNLDPANEAPPYPCEVDISDLIALSDVTSALDLGPNGGKCVVQAVVECRAARQTSIRQCDAGLMYCMEHLEANQDWLCDKLMKLAGRYVIIDCPGQAELYTHHASFYNIFQRLQRNDFRVGIDSFPARDFQRR